jgi:hypothetical protein
MKCEKEGCEILWEKFDLTNTGLLLQIEKKSVCSFERELADYEEFV